MHKLRNYQRAAIDTIRDYWNDGGENPLVSMATGVGKSVVIANLCKELLQEYPGLRILGLVHVKELVEQDAKAIIRSWQQAPIGINSAGLGRRDYHSEILFASIQSVYRKADLLGPRDVVLIDECHLVPKDGEGMYRSLLEKLRETVPDLRVCGFSATPYRLDSGRLDDGEGERLFTDLVYDYDLAQAVEDGWLAPLVGKAMKSEIDVSGVARRGGEFVAGSLERAADKADVVAGACDEMVEWGRRENRKKWLAFCSGIEHAIHVRDAIRERGVSCETVHSKLSDGERDSIIKRYREGSIQCLTNAMVLTTGFDDPGVDLIAMLRPTLSTGLYVQKLGRGTRPVYPHGFDPNAATKDERVSAIQGSTKPNCLVLDFAGNCRRHGPVDAVVITSKKKGEKGSPEKTDPDTIRAKICPACQTYNALSTLKCVTCGHEWPKPEPKHSSQAEAVPVMTREFVDKWLGVRDMRLDLHRRDGGTDSMVVEYQVGFQSYREWVCFEHKGFPRFKAECWWRMMGGQKPEPRTVQEALNRAEELTVPQAITIRKEGKYWRVSKFQIVKSDFMVEFDEKYNVQKRETANVPPVSQVLPPWQTPAKRDAMDDEIPF